MIQQQIQDDIEARTKRGQSLETPMGRIDNPQTQRLLTFMITTLNASFPEYDFSSLTADCFEKFAHRNAAIDQINMKVLKPVSNIVPGFQDEVWQAMAEAIDPARCEVLSLVVDPDVMIFAMNKLWTDCIFFYNPSLKRILLFFCAARSKLSPPSGAVASMRVDDEDTDSEHHHHHHHHHHHNSAEEFSCRYHGEEQFDVMEEESEFGDLTDAGDDDEDLGIGGTGSAALDPSDFAGSRLPRSRSLAAGSASAVAQRGGGAIVDVTMLDWDDADAHRTVLFLPDLPHLAPTFVPRTSTTGASGSASLGSTPATVAVSPKLLGQASGTSLTMTTTGSVSSTGGSGTGSGLLTGIPGNPQRMPPLALAAQASLSRIRPINPVAADRWPKRIEIDDEIKSPHTFSQRFASNLATQPSNDSVLPASAISSSASGESMGDQPTSKQTTRQQQSQITSGAVAFPLPPKQ